MIIAAAVGIYALAVAATAAHDPRATWHRLTSRGRSPAAAEHAHDHG
jgi:hypothetical protein